MTGPEASDVRGTPPLRRTGAWYGNPHSAAMGVLGQSSGTERAGALQRQAAAYAPLMSKSVVAAYHLVAVVAQPTAGADRTWRRRESPEVIRALLERARTAGFLLVLDIQPGRSSVEEGWQPGGAARGGRLVRAGAMKEKSWTLPS